MATSELAVVDTNVLVYAFDKEAEHFEDSRALLESAKDPDAGLLVTPQVVAEFLAVTTSSRVETPLEPAQAAATLGSLLMRPGISVLPVVPTVPAKLLELITRHPVRGVRVHDFHIAATMIENGVKRLFTYDDPKDFPFEEIEALRPPRR
jgi:predicted nucleic acid-binding protein